LSRCSETKAAVISGHVASGPSSPDAVSGPSSPDAPYSDKALLESDIVNLFYYSTDRKRNSYLCSAEHGVMAVESQADRPHPIVVYLDRGTAGAVDNNCCL